MNDPRPQNLYGKLYSVEFLGNMVGGQSTLYNNQPIEVLKKAAADSIKEGEVGGDPGGQPGRLCCYCGYCIRPGATGASIAAVIPSGGLVWLRRRQAFPQQVGH